MLPPNRPLVSHTPIRRTAALERVVDRTIISDPRVEQCNMSIITPRPWPKSPNKVTRLQVLPRDLRTNINESDGRLSRRRSVHCHGDESRAVGAVVRARWVGVGSRLGIRDVEIDPDLAAGEDLLAANGAIHSRAAANGGALFCDHADRACLYKVVGNIAAIGCEIPEVVSLDSFASDLAGEADFVAQFVGSDDIEGGRGARAAVYEGAGDGVCDGYRESAGDGQG